jgi:subtilisin family serine protease
MSRTIRVAIIDSGVHEAHPHVGGRVSGFGLREDGSRDPDYVDRIGHGTAVAGAIREKVPAAEILAIKVFWDALRSDAATLARAIDEASAAGAEVINLSLGTAAPQHAAVFAAAVVRARQRGSYVIAARDQGSQRWIPGILEGVVGVRVDWDCARDRCRVMEVDGRRVLVASGYPREIPGVPRERNLKGLSFAVANAAGLVARTLDAGDVLDLDDLLDRLSAGA